MRPLSGRKAKHLRFHRQPPTCVQPHVGTYGGEGTTLSTDSTLHGMVQEVHRSMPLSLVGLC